MKLYSIVLIFIVVLFVSYCYRGDDATVQVNDTPALQTALVWSDEFEEDGLPDPNKWQYDVGDGCDLPCGCGWGNRERQYYTKNRLENARVENGLLIIEAHKEKHETSNYTSARLVSKGNGEWKYGRMEIRARVPSGVGVWPAIWMLPSENAYGLWPKSGEIDIMEHVGYMPDSIFGTAHTQLYNGMLNTQAGGSLYLPGGEKGFHNYVVDWSPEIINWYVDDVKYFSFKNDNNGSESWPFDQTFHLIMNVAVGGNWGGAKGVDDSIWPRRMEVDYVRVFKEVSSDQLTVNE